MTCKTILRTTLAALVALMLVAAPAAAAVPDRQDAPSARWSFDLGSLVERFQNVFVWALPATTEDGGDPEGPPLADSSEGGSCDDCSDGGPDLDPNG